MTNVELRKQIKDLGGKGYSAMNKAQLEEYLMDLTQANEFDEEAELLALAYGSQEDINPNDHITNEEEQQMTNEVTQVKEFTTRTEKHKSFTTFWKYTDPVTEGQKKLYHSLVRNFTFDKPSTFCKNALEMSKLLYDMELQIDNGEVQRRPEEEIIHSLQQARREPIVKAQAKSNYPSPKQINWLKDLGKKLNRVVVIPQTKKEASDLIQALDKEYQKSLFQATATQKVAATSDVEPTEKKQSFFQKIVQFFKRG